MGNGPFSDNENVHSPKDNDSITDREFSEMIDINECYLKAFGPKINKIKLVKHVVLTSFKD